MLPLSFVSDIHVCSSSGIASKILARSRCYHFVNDIQLTGMKKSCMFPQWCSGRSFSLNIGSNTCLDKHVILRRTDRTRLAWVPHNKCKVMIILPQSRLKSPCICHCSPPPSLTAKNGTFTTGKDKHTKHLSFTHPEKIAHF